MTTHTLKLAIAALAFGLAGCVPTMGTARTTQPVSGATVGDKPVDATLANRGATVWIDKSCYTCHGIGRKLAGPDLIGITERRDHDWLRAWLRNTDSMMVSGDAQVKAMMAENHGARMPNFKLQSNDITALFHYLAQESARARAAGK